MKKEFTIGDLVKVLSKFDPDLPLYDSYDDENEGKVWFNLQKPRPKVVNLRILHKRHADGVMLKLTADKDCPDGWKKIENKKVIVLYPLAKDEIEIDI